MQIKKAGENIVYVIKWSKTSKGQKAFGAKNMLKVGRSVEPNTQHILSFFVIPTLFVAIDQFRILDLNKTFEQKKSRSNALQKFLPNYLVFTMSAKTDTRNNSIEA